MPGRYGRRPAGVNESNRMPVCQGSWPLRSRHDPPDVRRVL